MKKYLIVVFTLFVFTGCFSIFSMSNENMSKDKIVFELKDDDFIVNLSNVKAIDTFNTCSDFSFILNAENDLYGKVFIEYIGLSQDCNWNGLSTSFFNTLFKDTLKIKRMQKMQTIDIKNYSFSTYKINDEFYVNMILQYTSFSSKIIVDYNGLLSKDLLSKLKPDYELKYLDRLRFSSDYNESLVLKNVFKGYFTKEYLGD